jgi:hypothetical protein
MGWFEDLIGLIDDGFTRVGTEFKAIRTLISGTATGDVSGLDTTATNLVDAVNEVLDAVGSGGVIAFDSLTDVVLTSPATGQMVRFNGSAWVNVDPTTYLQPRDAELDVWSSTSLDTDGALAADSDTRVPSQKAIRTYFAGQIAALNVQVFKGTIDASANPNYPAADAGHTYVVSVAGRIGGGSGPQVEVGDMLLCLVDGTAAGTHASVGANWDVLQMNLQGAVTGPTSSVSGNLPRFNGTSGKVIEDSGTSIGDLVTEAELGSIGSHSFVTVFETGLT